MAMCEGGLPSVPHAFGTGLVGFAYRRFAFARCSRVADDVRRRCEVSPVFAYICIYTYGERWLHSKAVGHESEGVRPRIGAMSPSCVVGVCGVGWACPSCFAFRIRCHASFAYVLYVCHIHHGDRRCAVVSYGCAYAAHPLPTHLVRSASLRLVCDACFHERRACAWFCSRTSFANGEPMPSRRSRCRRYLSRSGAMDGWISYARMPVSARAGGWAGLACTRVRWHPRARRRCRTLCFA